MLYSGEEVFMAEPKRKFTPEKLEALRLERRFAVTQKEATNRVWAGDITYIPTREGWL